MPDSEENDGRMFEGNQRSTVDRTEEAEIRRRWAGGDENAMAALLSLYQRQIYAFVRRWIGSEAEAEELTQEVFLVAFRRRKDYDPARSVRPWLYGIALNICRNYRRAGARREHTQDHPVEGTPMWNEPGATANPEEEAFKQENIARVQGLLAQLSEADRSLLLLRHCQGMTYAELKETYGVAETVLKMRASRALARLRKLAIGSMQ